MKYTFVKSLSAMLLLCFVAFAAHATQEQELRDSRYCEIILSKTSLDLSIYSTIGLNDCPENNWKNIITAAVRRDTGAFFAYLNGPRYWVIDGIEKAKSINPEPRLFGGITMREAGVLHLTLMDIIKGAAAYREHSVERKTTWVYKAGRRVYELVNPQGQVYVMQSYSTQRSALTEEKLADLNDQLKLLKGWHFRSVVLTKDAHLTASHNIALVIRDNLLNLYQKAENDFIQETAKT
jgi:hypothetical protein